jgi:hypothetical protein
VLPFVFIDSLLTGRRLVSLPFTSYCNPLMPDTRLEEAIRYALGRFRGVEYVELKLLSTPSDDGDNARWGKERPFVSQILPLSGSIHELFRSLHDTSIRQRVRRAERDGLTFRLAGGELELRRFYQLLVEVRRGEGLPSPPYAFFANMQRLLSPGNLFELAVVESNGRIIAAAVVLKGRSTWHLEYSASDARFLKHGANQLLIWECIKRAHQEKATHFDFGRTSLWHRSLLEFKERWHAERHPIRYRYFPDTIKPPQWHDISNSFLIRLNKKLPAAFLQLAGRIIYPHRG